MADPADLVAEATGGPRPLITVRLLAWVAVGALAALVSTQVWFELRMDDHMQKHDGQLTDIRVTLETVKGQIDKVDGKVTANSEATNARMDGMQGMIQRVFDAEFPTLKDANEARRYQQEHEAPAVPKKYRHHHSQSEDIGQASLRWEATL